MTLCTDIKKGRLRIMNISVAKEASAARNMAFTVAHFLKSPT